MAENLNDISSPPYPSVTVTSAALFRYLDQIRNWVFLEQSELRCSLPPDQWDELEMPAEIPPITVWEGVSVMDKHIVLMRARKLREQWDVIVRDFEDSWDSKVAVHHRLQLAKMARWALDESCIDNETRDARMAEMDRDAKRHAKIWNRHFVDNIVPDELRDKFEEQLQEFEKSMPDIDDDDDDNLQPI